jgi:hypothetical protein
MEALGQDPVRAAIDELPDLPGVLERLSAVLSSGTDAPKGPG